MQSRVSSSACYFWKNKASVRTANWKCAHNVAGQAFLNIALKELKCPYFYIVQYLSLYVLAICTMLGCTQHVYNQREKKGKKLF